MSEVVDRLCSGWHEVEASRAATAAELKEQLERGFVLLRFPTTRGGTELGFEVTRSSAQNDGVDFERPLGSVTIVGDLSLDFVLVQCVAEIDLETLRGRGRLQRIAGREEDA